MDRLSKEHRSWNMSRIRSKNTKPEILIRSALHKKGFRFRLHRKDLPCKPDMVFSKHNAVIFVHGCFWHLHGCKYSKIPDTRKSWWLNKLEKNKMRDQDCVNQLLVSGWRVLIIWECIIKENKNNMELFIDRITDWLNSDILFWEIQKNTITKKEAEP